MIKNSIADRYKKFQNDYGSGNFQDSDILIESLFSQDYTKVINGKMFVANRNELKAHLEDLYKQINGWRYEETRTIKSESENDYVLWYKVYTGKGEIFDFITILNSSDGNKIDSVFEVCYKVNI